MTAKELFENIERLKQECKKQQNELRYEYASEHNPVRIGDVITDYIRTMRVTGMTVFGDLVPYMGYLGVELTRKGIEKKHQPSNQIPVFQTHVKFINGKPYNYRDSNPDYDRKSEITNL